MKRLAIIGCALGLALGFALGLALAPAAFGQDLPSVEYDGKHPVTLRYRDLTVTIDSVRGSAPKARVPVVKGRLRDREVFSLKIEEGELENPSAKARVVWLDRDAAYPQVVITAYTGGAHCCTVTDIATMAASDTWRVVKGPWLDGDGGFDFADIDHDGVQEMISYDNSFLYAFASYADSFAPMRIASFVGGEIKDVTGDPKYRDYLRGWVRDMEADARKDPALWHSNGFLGGWVAAKSLVGEVDDAWSRMLESYDRKSDWSMQECTTGAALDKCPQDKLRDLTFPQALKKLMADGGYPLPKNGR